jgi:hypothetical protein
MQKAFGVFFTSFIAFVAGYFFSFKSGNFPLYETEVAQVSSKRDPAAIKRVYDFSGLEGSALSWATKQRLINGARVVKMNDEIGMELGHFVIRGTQGEKIFACQKYSKVEFIFQGDGVATSGESPIMSVEGSCEISSDINKIAAVWIPVKRILGEPVADGEFDFREGRPVRVRFANVIDQWPKLWRLQAVRLIGSESDSDFVEIGQKEIREISSDPILVKF